MKVLIWSPKGGVGKSSLSVMIQQSIKNAQIITNDKNHPYGLLLKENDDYYLLPAEQEIPQFNNQSDINLVYDFGGYPDQRLKSFIKNTKDLLILIPFNPDIISFQSAISVFNEIKPLTENIVFVLNRAKKNDLKLFEEQMKKIGIKKAILEIKESKLFQNVYNKRETLSDIKNNKLLNHTYRPALDQLNLLVKELKK